MSVQWSGLGPELLLRLDRELAEPLGAQLERELRDAIRSGRLGAGRAAPVLARAGARARCLPRPGPGVLRAAAGRGLPERDAPARRRASPRWLATPAPPAPRGAPASGRLRIDFQAGRPDLTTFPRQDWLWALREVSRTAPADALGYGDPRGSAELREVLAAYLRRVRGAVVDPERIVICTGFAQGVTLVLRALAADGVRAVAVEDPGDVDQQSVARRASLDAVAVPVDDQGVVVEALAATSARAALLTPAHQSPTGGVLGPARRQELVDWATERRATIIEDDYDAEFRYDRDPVGALQGLAPEHVAMLGTVSKSLAPAVRLGWVVCPAHLLEPIAREKELTDRGSPALDQLALAALMRSGRYDRHLRRMRRVYAAKRQALIDALARHAPGVELRGLAAGFHAVARLPAAVDVDAVVEQAAERSVGLYPMSAYRTRRADDHPPELVLGFGNLSEAAIERGIAAIGDLLTGG